MANFQRQTLYNKPAMMADVCVKIRIMETITLNAHFDGEQIVLDEPHELKPNTKLLVSVIQPQNGHRDDWTGLALSSLERAYSDDEPEYSIDMIKERNPAYEGR